MAYRVSLPVSSGYYSTNDALAANAHIEYCKYCGCILTHYRLSILFSDNCYECDDLAQAVINAQAVVNLEAASYADYDPSATSYRYSSSRYGYIDSSY